MATSKKPGPEAPALGSNPLSEDDDDIYSAFISDSASSVGGQRREPRVIPTQRTRPSVKSRARGARPRTQEAPSHYKVVSISLYNEDIEKLDQKVRELKKRGFTKANRSALIRFALDTVDISQMPRGY